MLFTALATLNLCFWHKVRCTCQRRDQANTLFLENISWGEKERSSLSSNHLDQRGINFTRVFLFRLKIGYIEQGPMILS